MQYSGFIISAVFLVSRGGRTGTTNTTPTTGRRPLVVPKQKTVNYLLTCCAIKKQV
jgi:hypothetical protein